MQNRLLDLKELGEQIGMVDQMIVDMLVARQRLSRKVGAYKDKHGGEIYRPDVEQRRLDDSRRYGRALGLNPEFVSLIMYAIIKESCMDQLVQRESGGEYRPLRVTSYEELRQNLTELTRLIASSFDTSYAEPFATGAYLKYEDHILDQEVEQIPREKRGTYIDLGCGTGGLIMRFGGLFKRSVGYDLSPEMLSRAREKMGVDPFPGREIRFAEADLEKGIPEKNASASLITCTLGTGSDIRDIKKIISETLRVLEPGGRFAFSFYNKNALIYQWPYLPWRVALSARVNLDDECLDVPFDGRVFQVFARPYTKKEAQSLFEKNGVVVRGMFTYPTISSIVPQEAFGGSMLERIKESLLAIDSQLAFGDHGAYILITGEKNA